MEVIILIIGIVVIVCIIVFATKKKSSSQNDFGENMNNNIVTNIPTKEVEKTDVDYAAVLNALEKDLRDTEPLLCLGWGSEEITQMAETAGMSPEEYRKFLHLSYYDKQRGYNQILKISGLDKYRKPVKVDSFDDYHDGKYKCMEPVEVDIEKRIAKSNRISHSGLLDKNDTYAFYQCDSSILRQELSSDQFVYFNFAGNACGCMFKDRFYWSDSTGIIADRLIYSREIDGYDYQEHDWLNNRKYLRIIGRSAHLVSVDTVISMESDENSMTITVRRNDVDNGLYKIIIRKATESYDLRKEIISGEFNI